MPRSCLVVLPILCLSDRSVGTGCLLVNVRYTMPDTMLCSVIQPGIPGERDAARKQIVVSIGRVVHTSADEDRGQLP